MSRSIRHHLWKTLVWVVLVCGLLASLLAFYFAYSEAQELQDDNLRQVAALLVGDRSPPGRSTNAHSAVDDPESRIQVIRLPDDPRPYWLPATLSPGFHTLPHPGESGETRVFAMATGGGARLVVAQTTESRNEIAYNSALRTLIPILVLLPILVVSIGYVVRRELTSLRRLAADLDRQTAEHLPRLPTDGLPDEVAPFVDAINRLLERVNRMIAEQRRFIADAAHELRTPLTALSLQARNLSHAGSVEECRERLQPLQAGIERSHRLTVQLLDLARLQAGGREKARADLAAMARELIAECLPLAQAKQLDLGLDLEESVQLESDPAALRLIMRNGLENAIKYSPPGGEVTLQLRRAPHQVTIQVVDAGPGIAAEDIDMVFQPFRRAAHAVEGSGLGLAIAREAAAQLGGELTLRNREDRAGLVYRFVQPM